MRTAHYLSVLGLHFLSALSVAKLGARDALGPREAVMEQATQATLSTPIHPSQAERRREADALAQRAAGLSKLQTKKSLTSAASLFHQSTQLFLSAGVPENAANSHFREGEIYVTLGSYDKARRSFQTATAITQNPELRCRALSAMTRIYASNGPLPVAKHYSELAINVCESLSQTAQADAIEARGEALDSAGEHAESEACFQRASDLFAAAGDDGGRARALLMLAYSKFFSDGEHNQGIDHARQAMQLWSTSGDQYGIAKAHSALGIFAITRGEFETAECNYRAAKGLFHQIGDTDGEASVLNGLGYVNREIGDWQKSLEFYQRARDTFASVQDFLGEHEAIKSAGKSLSALGNYSEMLSAYKAGLRVAKNAKDPLLVASSLSDIGEAYAVMGDYAQAELFYRQSLSGYRAANHIYGEGDVLMRLSRLLSQQKMYSQAIATLEEANTLKEKTGQIEDIAKVQYEFAWIFRRLNRLDDALTAIQKSIDIIESQRITLSNFDARALYFGALHKYYALYIQILMLLPDQGSRTSLASRAFEASERSKVRSLLDLLTESDQSVPCDERLRHQLEPPRPEVIEVADEKRTPVPTPTMTLEQIQAEIAEDTILLEFALGDEKSYVWVVERSGIAVHELPAADKITKLVERLRKTIVPPQLRDGESGVDFQERAHRRQEAYVAYAKELSRQLLGSISLGSCKRILVVPDGALQYVPFAALPLPQRWEDLLIQRYEVDTQPSASVLGTLRRTNRAAPSATAIIFADPVFEPNDPRISGSGVVPVSRKEERSSELTRAVHDIGGSTYIPRLLASREEANTIARILRSVDPEAVRIEMDFAASRETVFQDGLSRYRLIHFATHGVIDTRQPEMSGLILSLLDRKGRKVDGYLRLADIYKLKLSADLVVLSSCDSALGKDLASEGIIGLPRGFLYAGAKRVIASMWKVEDTATAKLMSSLYARMQQGESPSAALRAAQLEMLHSPIWSRPYYWAAFALQGEYR